MSTPCFPTVVFQARRPNLQVDKMQNAVCPTKASIGMTPVRLSPLGSTNYLDFQKNFAETLHCDITAIGSLHWIGKTLNFGVLKMLQGLLSDHVY
jgi:hypothetical protein